MEDTGASQASVMNLVEVMTASRLVGGEGRLCSTTGEPPSRDTGRAVVTMLVSAVTRQNKTNLE